MCERFAYRHRDIWYAPRSVVSIPALTRGQENIHHPWLRNVPHLLCTAASAAGVLWNGHRITTT